MAALTFIDVRGYFEANNFATRLLLSATKDYAAARCLLLSGHSPGLQLGAQAIEKTLKAFLLLDDPKLNVREMSHSLSKLLDMADRAAPSLLLSESEHVAKRFGQHFQSRYPDNADGSVNPSSAEIGDLDRLIVHLNESLSCPRNVKYLTGFYSAITFSLGYAGTVTPLEFWIKERNDALAPLLARISSDYKIVMAELYPD